MDALKFQFISFLFFLLFSVSSAADSISFNQPLSGTQKLTSEGGNFELGFFQPGNSPHYYIGIWYNLERVPELTSVWVANRENPITDPKTAELKISVDGNLMLSNQSNARIWSTNTTLESNSTVVVLLDSGNLVLRERSITGKTLWQSFDHPTNTWLPGAKVGVNKVTGDFQQLFSWKSIDDPAPGVFHLQIDPSGSGQFWMIWNNSYIYWTSGKWNEKVFSSVPEMTYYTSTNSSIYNFQYVSNSTDNYFTYSIKSNIFTRLIVDVSGQIIQLTWLDSAKEWIQFFSQPKLQCQVHAVCGPFGICNENAMVFCNCIEGFSRRSPSDWESGDRTRGCMRNTPLQCGNYSSTGKVTDRFYAMYNVRMPDRAQSLNISNALDCEIGCLKDCSCTAYSYSGSGCSIWFGDLINLQERYSGPGGANLFLRLAASVIPHHKRNKVVVISSVIGAVVGSIALAWFLILRRRRRDRNKLELVSSSLIAYGYTDLQRFTKNFSNKLGGGSFGSVFKGVALPDHTVIAVKKLEGIQQGEKQFLSEVRTIGIVQHVNVVRLHGFCSERNHKLLVYEYMPNGSLDRHLLRNDSTGVLDWKTRYQIALGTARGLAYLHEQCRDRIIHCDIKPENILLDASFVPKIADFGLAKLVARDFSRVLTTVRGTVGYLAPEWISGVAITAKADVYSYGMMLFEIISGKRNSDDTEGSKPSFFPFQAATKLIEGDALGLLDHRLQGIANLEEVTRICKVACWCIQDNENSRPSMLQVVLILEGILEVDTHPIPRSLQILSGKSENMLV